MQPQRMNGAAIGAAASPHGGKPAPAVLHAQLPDSVTQHAPLGRSSCGLMCLSALSPRERGRVLARRGTVGPRGGASE
ncbi:MAG: hypothetical protein ACPIOQ_06260 [Promethearchaeia archaeon]